MSNLIPQIDVRILSTSPQSDLPHKTYSYHDIEAVLDWQPQASIVCTPATTHLSIALQFLSRSIPTLIEKPLCVVDTPPSQIQDCIRFSKQTTLLIGYTLRFSNGHKKLIEAMHRYDLGSLVEIDFYCGSYLPDWRPRQDYMTTVSAQKELGGGVIYELSHGIDLVNSIAGPHELLYANSFNSSTLHINVEDTMTLVAKPHDLCITTVRQNFCTQPPARVLSLRFSDGQIEWDLIKQNLRISVANAPDKLYDVSEDRNEMFKSMLNHFFDSINNKTTPACGIYEALNVLEIQKGFFS